MMVVQSTFRTARPSDISAGTIPVPQNVQNFEAPPRTFRQLLVERAAKVAEVVPDSPHPRIAVGFGSAAAELATTVRASDCRGVLSGRDNE
ncbi:hypothetical protein MI170_16140 [Mycolicibacterium goodii]|uniref:hypothetical protein n=1 Tax=Mycolicibacterium goodii TaxID=134601 RepID=UPI001F03381B|nr:hypothetical protein [Mycolicibacterium goodii]ULN44928.1 hypothetical protein MI170_16140 [Mycolicibacterium goodii]